MEELLLFIVVIPFFIAGYYLVKKVDVFLDTSKYNTENDADCREADSVIIPGEKSLIEIDQEINSFRQKHEMFDIILRDTSRNDIMENEK